MFFDDWFSLLRVALLGGAAYVAVIAVLRLSGKRTLAKMNAFDLVVTVALGSMLATILLNSDVPLAEGMAGILVLVVLQYVIAALSVRWKWMENLAKSDASLLLCDGRIDRDALRRERVTHEEVLCAVRSAGLGDIADVAAVVLETDGSFSVVAQQRAGNRSALPIDPRGNAAS